MGSERVDVHTEEPTVLLVAAGERLAHALTARLTERGLAVETAEPSEVAQVAFAAAPDLVVLAGAAAHDGGLAVLSALAARPVTATLPVVLVTEERESSPRLSAFRHGVVAVIERSASADEMARRIAELARELPERSGEATGTLRRASVDELVELFAASLRSGILAVRKEGGASAQILLRADQPVEEAIAQLVERLRPLVASDGDGELQYEFHESAPSRISSLDVGEDHEGSASRLHGRRVLVIEQNAARSDRLGQELRSAGALVVVADGTGHGLELARDLTPDVVVVDGTGVEGWAIEALRQIRRDIWLRWASLLLVDSEKLWRDRRRPDVALLAAPIDAQLQQDRELSMRAMRGREVGTRLEVVGPFRTLRALAETRLGLRITVRNPRLIVEIDLADGLVAGASAREPHAREHVAEGSAALTALFGLSSGRVHVVRADAPKSANLMAPLDDAIAAAANEEPVIPPSLPPPSLRPPAPVPSAMPKEDLEGLVQRLETLLAQLRETTAEAPAAPAPPVSSAVQAPPTNAAPPSELPPIGAEDVDTGVYAPEMVQRLRARMRQSSQRIVAVTEENASASDETPRPSPPAALEEKKSSAAGTNAPAAKPAGVPRPAPRPPPAAKKIPPAALPSPSASARRVGQRVPTLTLGSVGDEPKTIDAPAASAAHEPPPEREARTETPPTPSATLDREPDDEPLEPIASAPEASAPREPATTSTPSLESELDARFAPAAPAVDSARRSSGVPRLALVLAGVPIVLALIGIGGWLALRDDDPEPSASLPTERAARDDEAATHADPHEQPSEPPAREEVQPRAPSSATTRSSQIVGPGPGEPLEGRAEEFDLARLGITPAERPSSRRVLQATITRHIRLANTARNRDELDAAEAGYRAVLALEGDNPRATAGLARVRMERGDAQNAVLLAQRLVRLRPELANNYILLGDTLLAGNNRDAARRAFTTAESMQPNFAAARERLAALDASADP